MAENNNEVAKVAINDIGTEEDFIKAVDSTIKNFIPSRELSIKKDVDPDEVVEVGDTIEALVVTKEDKEGRLILSKKRAQYERAWGDIEKIKEADGVVEGTVIEAVKGGLIVDIGLRGFLPASLVATTWSSPVASTSRRPSPKCARPSCPSLRRARSVKASCPPSSTSARSSIWAVLTA